MLKELPQELWVEGIKPGVTAITLNYPAKGIEDVVKVTVVEVMTVSVDATNPHAVKVNYRVLPENISIGPVTFLLLELQKLKILSQVSFILPLIKII